MLHHERRRVAEIAEREAAGEDLWTHKFNENIRVKIRRAMAEATQDREEFIQFARRQVMSEVGLESLSGISGSSYSRPDFDLCIKISKDVMMPTIIEAYIRACRDGKIQSITGIPDADAKLGPAINSLLRSYRISYQLADDLMVPLKSFELHASVIEPTIRLLSHSQGWESVEKPYLEALDEIKNGNPGNAITDSATALQEALKLLGCEGRSLGPLIDSGIRNGIILAHDRPMLDSIEKVFHWVSADRSTLGDAHNSEEPAIDDAWFTVHVVGAILVRLNSQTLRGTPRA